MEVTRGNGSVFLQSHDDDDDDDETRTEFIFACCYDGQNSLSSVDGLIKKHDGFTTTLEAQREKITTLEQLCQALLAQDHYASEQIKSRCDGVVDRMGRIMQLTESRRLKLLESRSYQQFLCNVYEVFNHSTRIWAADF